MCSIGAPDIGGLMPVLHLFGLIHGYPFAVVFGGERRGGVTTLKETERRLHARPTTKSDENANLIHPD